MADEPVFDSRQWSPETGVSAGDERENDPRAAGFTPEDDRVFRSHFQHVNRLADRRYEQVRPAYALGRAAARERPNSRSFEEVEKDLENGWLNVRVGGAEWGSVREFARAGFDSARQGRVVDALPAGRDERPPFSDPVSDDLDPTSPESPEQTLEYQHDAAPEPQPIIVGDLAVRRPGDVQESKSSDEI